MANKISQTPFLFWALLAVVVWAPLPFGSNRPWSWSLLTLLVGLLMLAWAVGAARNRAPMPIGWRHAWPVALPFLTALLWGWLQTVTFLPEQWNHPIWQIVAAQLNSPVTGRIAVDADRPDIFLTRLLAYGGVFWLAMQYGRDTARAALAFKVLMIAGSVYAAYGIAAYLAEPKTILWFAKWAYQDNVTSTFVNRNNYATYAGLILVITVALTYDHVRRQIGDITGWRQILTSAVEAVAGRPLGSLFVIALLAAAILLSQSRGGLISSVAGVTAVLAVLALSARASRRSFVLGGIAMLAIFSALVWISGGATIYRLDTITTEIEAGRPLVYALTLEAARDAPWLGFGLGSFADVFQAYRPQTIRATWSEAHNAYVELILDLGYPMAITLLLSLLIATGYCLRGVFQRRRDKVYPATAFAASILVGIHSLFDFSLQIPAIALTYAFILGIGFSQAFNTDSLPEDTDRKSARRL